MDVVREQMRRFMQAGSDPRAGLFSGACTAERRGNAAPINRPSSVRQSGRFTPARCSLAL